MKICPKCGANQADEELFCSECGAKLGGAIPIEKAENKKTAPPDASGPFHVGRFDIFAGFVQ